MTKPIKAIVVDDESPSRANLAIALQAYPEWSLEGSFARVAPAMNHLEQNPVDAVFLDIQMPKENGLAMARRLSTLPAPPVVIFVTAFNHYAIDAFQVHALDYLLKPFDDVRFRQTLERASWMITLKQQSGYGDALRDCVSGIEADSKGIEGHHLNRFIVRSTSRIEIVPIEEVEWIASAGNYVELHLASRVVLHRITMAQLDRHLDPAEFIRVHRSFFVRKGSIAAFESNDANGGTLILRSQARVTVSPKHLREVKTMVSHLSAL